MTSFFLQVESEFSIDLTKDIIQCFQCGYQCYDVDELVSHRAFVHKPVSPYICGTCNTSFPNSDILNTHGLERHMCPFVKPFMCEHCTISFTTADKLWHHVKVNHLCSFLNIAHLSKQSREKQMEELEKAIERYKHPQEVNQEISTSTSDSQEVSTTSSIGQEVSTISSNTQEALALISDHVPLDKLFNSSDTLCENCNRYYCSPERLQLHRSLAHEGRGKFKCPGCPRTFTSSSRLKIHLSVHSTARNHKCHLCPAKLKTSITLRWHMLYSHRLPGLNADERKDKS